jgi:hypothetical protein
MPCFSACGDNLTRSKGREPATVRGGSSMMKAVLASLLLVFAVGCALTAPDLTVRPGTHLILDRLAVETTETWPYGGVRGKHGVWSDSTTARSFYNMMFFVGIEPGERLFGDFMPDAPPFLPEFTPEQIGRAVLNSYASPPATNPQLVEVIDAEFVGHPGFRFEYRYGQGQSVWRGLYVGAVVDGRLYMIGFRGYDAAFTARRPSAERVIASARLVDRTAAQSAGSSR